ncbi:hypothetical protein HHI36_010759 [Cryptolaemus montrouzieri]|uniref:Uncharacterized protein n=1 Tax=Cryptolaemus montrouzieri TaxID=559131 RepID=A0ABD2MJS4_9CUCU
MSTPKSRKNQPWIECVSCGCTFLSKDTEKHTSDCPPSADNVTHFYINNGALVGDLDIKKNDEIKGLSLNEIENLVFISQNAIQLCDLSIGEFVMIKAKDFPPIVKKVWPTVERSLTSVLLSKNVLDLNFGDVKTYPNVVVTKIINPTKEAKKISLILLGGSKLGNLNQVLISRLNFAYRESYCVKEIN